ncbi:uncharacterized protein BT62DRAFT_472765 [Guyanagaster necrorhizus]|uniref:Uncharacterized protein n=1 Tax=Guyanagaster necrorhizus TaxID=856835 RepID=A0A9P7VJN4_9AGAR|nr:uncharacterized protein BT62DRAFT_472765 [Guyanagaster necrorhizus MCA 3950]KAG7441760.1 hypothetical protein BT62DRAFT_472765 [Guyanagaster necrorhizus MCA 3950]
MQSCLRACSEQRSLSKSGNLFLVNVRPLSRDALLTLYLANFENRPEITPHHASFRFFLFQVQTTFVEACLKPWLYSKAATYYFLRACSGFELWRLRPFLVLNPMRQPRTRSTCGNLVDFCS